MKKLLFVFNPKSGKGQIKNKLMEILDIFTKSGYEVTVHPTQKFKDAKEVVTERAKDYDLVVCSGGDGTLDEVVGGMMKSQQKIPIGYIPSGTTNDFARSLKVPKNMIRAAHIAVQGKKFPCDIGVFNEEFFVYIAAFGLFTDVSYQTRQEMKNVVGHMAYVLEGMKRLYTIKSYDVRVEYEGGIIEEDCIFGMVTNATSVGGFKSITNGNVALNDGLFEVMLVKKPKNPIELQEIIAALLIQEYNTRYMHTFKTDWLKVESKEELSWTLDGEYGGDHKQVVIENHKEAINFLIPHKKKKIESE